MSNQGIAMLKYLAVVITLCLSFASPVMAQDQYGLLTGTVVDASTQQPLVGVNLLILDSTHMGTVTDLDGSFSLRLPAGNHSIRASYVGYQPVVRTNIVVSTGRPVHISIQMREEAVSLGEVVVTADYFRKSATPNMVSTIGLDKEEVRRSPGSAQDMQRIIHTLPGVANSNDQNNELIVRGGAPDENLTVMDYMEIPSTNHYPNQFNSGGPINMVNVDLIEDISFSTGGFSAEYGDKLSSVMDIKIREGDRTRVFSTNSGFNMAGFYTTMEGKIGTEGRGSWLFSYRKSFLEVVDDILGLGTLGLTAVPKYWDSQFKIVYDLGRNHRLQMSGIYGDDRILFEGNVETTDPAKAGLTDSVGINTIDFTSRQYAAGMSLKSLWGSSGYTVLTLYTVGNTYFTNVKNDFTERRYSAIGKVAGSRVVNSRLVYSDDSRIGEAVLKLDGVFKPFERHEISAGGAVKYNLPIEARTRWDNDTARYDFDGDGTFEIPALATRGGDISLIMSSASQYKAFVYIADKITLTPRLTTKVGLRYDYFSYSVKNALGPRVSFSYLLLPPSTTVTFSYGEYFQTQPYPLYFDPRNTDLNRYLENSHARHFVVGIERIFDRGLKISLEAYSKQYSDLPVRESFIHSDDRTYRSDRLLSVGEGYARGIEFFIQKKLVDDYYGTLSYSYSVSRWKDIREKPATDYYPSPYDYPHIATLVFGKMVKNARAAMDEMPWWIKYPSYLLPLSDDMEISFRWRYASGRPYTPRIFTTREQHREGGVRWSRGTWVKTDRVNSERYPDYHRLDLLWLSRLHLRRWNLVLYLSIQNVYGRRNIAAYRYTDDGERENVYQWGFFPVGGVQVEF